MARTVSIVVVAGLVTVMVFGVPAIRNPIAFFRILFTPMPDVLPVPVAGVEPERIRDSWGAPRGADRRHEGIDIFAPRGTAVKSTTRGVVAQVGQSNLGGNVVWIFGPRGSRHYYAHLDRFADIRPGQVVSSGDTIGYVGDSGNARGGSPHLHYGIYGFGGGAMNPFPYLRSGG